MSDPQKPVTNQEGQSSSTKPQKRYVVENKKEAAGSGTSRTSKHKEEIVLPKKYTPLKNRKNPLAKDFNIIGHGAQGSVIEAELKVLKEDSEESEGRNVVLKRLKLDLVTDVAAWKDMKREWEMAVAIRHPRIVEFIEAFHSKKENKPNFFYLVFEKMDRTLEDYYYYESLKVKNVGLSQQNGIEQMVPRDHKFFAVLATQLLRAADYLHNLGILHRDLKPQNIGVNYDPFVVKLFDFGHSRYSGKHMTDNKGTRAYNAPEILLREKYDTKVDIWSLGITLLGFFGYNPLIVEPVPKTLGDLFGRILRITGTPRPPVNEKLKEVKDYDKYERMKSLRDVFPSLQLTPDEGQLTKANLFNLFEQMLGFYPTDRMSATELLKHGYLDGSNKSYEAIDLEDQHGENDQDVFMRMVKRQSYCV